MNIKSFMALAVAALTVAACSADPEAVEVPVNEDAAAAANLNDDGSVATGPAEQLELDSGEINPREVNEDNPTGP
jgi:hypothetical protein